jgi:hypothetical protein
VLTVNGVIGRKDKPVHATTVITISTLPRPVYGLRAEQTRRES